MGVVAGATLLDGFLEKAESEIDRLNGEVTFCEGDKISVVLDVKLVVEIEPTIYLGSGPELRRARLRAHVQRQVAEAFGLGARRR